MKTERLCSTLGMYVLIILSMTVSSLTLCLKYAEANSLFPITQCANISEADVWSPSLAGDEFQFGGTDRHAVYWRLALPVLDPLKFPNAWFELQGEFPHATYFSIHVNTNTSAFLDKLTDYEILPNPNSKNPFLETSEYSPGNFYAVKIVNKKRPQDGREDNTLYLGDGSKKPENYIIVMYRIYEPSINKDGGVKLPKVYFATQQAQDNLIPSEVCKNFKPKGAVPDFLFSLEKRLDKRSERLERRTDRLSPFYRPPNPVEFIVGDNFLGMIRHAFPVVPNFLAKENPTGANMDTRYLAGFLDPSFDAAVLRFKPPKVKEKVRYWSVGVYQPFNGLMYARAVASHRELKRDPDGYVTIVFTSEKNKPNSLFDPISQQPSMGKYNWMPYGGSYPLVWFRYLVPTPAFREALLHYKGDPYDATAIRNHMKEYYPWVRYLTLKELNRFILDDNLWKIMSPEHATFSESTQ